MAKHAVSRVHDSDAGAIPNHVIWEWAIIEANILRHVFSLLAILVVICVVSVTPALAQDGQIIWPAPGDGSRLLPVTDALQLAASLRVRPSQKGRFGSQALRDPAAIHVYQQVAPAVVFVEFEDSHGTGFFVSDDGWIVTNHHVVERAPYDVDRNVTTVNIRYGTLGEDGEMQLADEVLPASVYRFDYVQDLALLKLDRLPRGASRVPFVQLAPKAPPGTTCLAIGHPTHGLLWTLRAGVVSGSGMFPRDQVSTEMFYESLALNAKQRQQLEQRWESQNVLAHVTLSTCGLNPGDSGGPLVDEHGNLLGVSFAGPTIEQTGEDEWVDLGKYSFHVHLAEVRKFLERLPQKSAIGPPSPWPPARTMRMEDCDDDQVPNALVFWLDRREKPSGILVDLDQDSFAEGNFPSEEDMRLVDWRTQWDFEFAVVRWPYLTLFYDTDNDAEPDLAFVKDDRRRERRYVRLNREAQNGWTASETKEQVFDAAFFHDEALRSSFETMKKWLFGS